MMHLLSSIFRFHHWFVLKTCFVILQDNPLANVKKIDSALLPPSQRTMEMKLLRARYVTILWSHASTSCPGEGLSPIDYGWSETDGVLQPIWFQGPETPNNLFGRDGEEKVTDSDDETIILGDTLDFEPDDELIGSDDEPWSDDSDSNAEEEEED